jgi:hypothetical protein
VKDLMNIRPAFLRLEHPDRRIERRIDSQERTSLTCVHLLHTAPKIQNNIFILPYNNNLVKVSALTLSTYGWKVIIRMLVLVMKDKRRKRIKNRRQFRI